MCVKNLMAVGKSFAIASSLLLLGHCATAPTVQVPVEPRSSHSSVETVYNSELSTPSVITNFLRFHYYMLPEEDKLTQRESIFFALNNLDHDVVTSWYNSKNNTQGHVKVVSSYPTGSGYCRVILSQIIYKGKQRSFSETACLNSTTQSWIFTK